jgi:Zn-finger domain-containing protein
MLCEALRLCENSVMRLYKVIHRAPIRVAKISTKRQQLRFKRAMVALKIALAQEKQETKEMLTIYRRYTQGDVSKEDLQKANAQFVDILKGLGLGVFAVLPFAPVTIPLVVKLGQWVGVDVLPSSFNINKSLKDIDQQIADEEQQHHHAEKTAKSDVKPPVKK